MSKIRRKVTVENSKTISDSSSNTTTSSTSNPAAPSRRPSVFERLGPSTGSNAADSHCRNWLKTGNCSYGNTCRYTHGTQPRGKGFNFSRSTERPTGDLRERMKNKRQDVDPENLKRDVDESTSPTARRDSSRGRRREKEDIKITKERTPASEEEPTEWETNREDSDVGDYDYELSLEMKRQKIQRELMKLEQENLEKREEIVVKKDETPTKTRVTAAPKASPEQLTIKNSPSPRKSSRSPKHKGGTKGLGSGKKEKKGTVSSPVSEATKSSKGSHSKKKGPRTPSPPPPVPLDIPVVGKKHKSKHKNKEKLEEKQKDGKDRGRDTEKHKEKKEKRRDRSDSSHKAKWAVTSEEHSGSVSSPSRGTSPPPRKKSSSPKASHKIAALSSPPNSSPSPPRHRHSPSPRHHSPSSHSGSSAQRHSASPRRRRSSSPTYHRSVGSAGSPLSSRRSRSPFTSHDASSPHRRSDRSSPSHRHSRGRERFRGERERSVPAQERRHDRRDENRSKREKDSIRDERDYDSELLSSRDTRSERDTRESRDRRDARERGRETTRDSRDNRDNRDAKDSRESRTETRSSRESLGSRERERDRDREKDKEREKERERDRNDTQRKEDTTQDDRSYVRGHGREDAKPDRAEKNGRVRSRANESSDKGSNRNARSSQLESSHDVWESRSSTVRERSVERNNDRSAAERSSERGSDRDRYESDRRGEPSRDSSYDRRGGHGERDRRDNRDRASPGRYQGRSEDSEREERREDRRTDRAEERREDRTRERERERDREKEKERDREREREKEREAERERARERERERERDREEREREREEREREREERERERKEREREREQRERERQREWEERERGREERRDRREDSRDERSIRDSRDDRKMSRKRSRVESSPSPRTTPKRAARDLSPADSDGYNSGEEKSERPIGRGKAKLHPQPLLPSPVCPPPSDSSDKHRLLSQVVRPQEPLVRTPPRSTSSDDKSGHWKDEERRGTLDKRDTRHLDDLEPRGERNRGDRRGELLVESHSDSRSRGRDSTPLPNSFTLTTGSDDRDTASSQSHEEGKKKTKSQRKGLKKGRKEDESGGNTNSGDRFNPEPPAAATADGPQPLYLPRKGAKKKALERKRKRSRGADSDVSDEDSSAQQPQSKRKRGPRTPPPSMRPDRRGNAEPSPLSKMDNFSDWSDEEVTEREGVPLEAPAAPAERTPTEPFRRGGPRVGRDRERCNPPAIAPLIPQDPPMLLQTLTPQPLMSQPLLRKPPLEQTRSSSMGSNQSRASSKRLRSPSNESAHRDNPQGQRSRRGRLQGANCRDRDRERERERERDRERERQVNDPPGAERKSRIDQLRRGEPSRSTSSDRQDSRSHSSRLSSPDSERQARSRAGSYDSRERERDREPFDRERERKDHRPQQQQQQQQQQQPLLLQQTLQQQRDWEAEPRDWPSRGREPLLTRPGREPLLRERDIRDRERLLPEGLMQQHERDRDGRGDRGSDRERERMTMDQPPHTELRAPGRGDLRGEMRGDLRADMMRQDRSDYELLLQREAFSPPDQEKPSNSLHLTEDLELEKTDSIDGNENRKDNDGESVASVGEEYEPISDDELDEILADSQKKEDQQDEEKITGPLDVIDVDWSSLMPKYKQEPRAAGAALLRFTPGAVLLRAGISKRLAGPELLEQVREVCKRELEDPKDAHKLFEQDLGALNRRMEKTSLLSNLGPYCKALCARRDFAIRRQLLKNDKGLTKQYPTTPVVDNELLQMSMRLFRRTVAAQTSGLEKSDGSAAAADAAAPAANKLTTAQPEVCVS